MGRNPGCGVRVRRGFLTAVCDERVGWAREEDEKISLEDPWGKEQT